MGSEGVLYPVTSLPERCLGFTCFTGFHAFARPVDVAHGGNDV